MSKKRGLVLPYRLGSLDLLFLLAFCQRSAALLYASTPNDEKCTVRCVLFKFARGGTLTIIMSLCGIPICIVAQMLAWRVRKRKPATQYAMSFCEASGFALFWDNTKYEMERTTTTTTAPPPTNPAHILAPASFPAAEPPHGNTNADPNDSKEDDEDAPLPFGVKPTGSKLINIAVIFSIGVAKFIVSLRGRPNAPTRAGLEWVGGLVLAILPLALYHALIITYARFYWIGLHEAVEPYMSESQETSLVTNIENIP
ncbi:hypothetical protein BC827DRAFT_1159035 [Russula dissimulans]|nr:hypothetical protein BC827DRAFT_1159035 [Russula dissimulans]